MDPKQIKRARLVAQGVRFVEGDEQLGTPPAEVPGENAPPASPGAPAKPAGEGVTGSPAQEDGEHGYPTGTPLADMSAQQQAAYWKHRSRSHEDKWKQVIDRNLSPEQILEMQQQLDAATRERMSDHEKQVDDAKKAAEADARSALMPQLVMANITAQVARRNPAMSDDDVRTRVEYLDLSKFLTSKGEVDADKVSNYAASITPEPTPGGSGGDGGKKKFPDMGGGKRGPGTESAKARGERAARERGWVRDDK